MDEAVAQDSLDYILLVDEAYIEAADMLGHTVVVGEDSGVFEAAGLCLLRYDGVFVVLLG